MQTAWLWVPKTRAALAGKGGSAAAALAARREQEDAAEFLHFLLDQAHEELLRLRARHAAQLDAPAGAPRSAQRSALVGSHRIIHCLAAARIPR